MSLGKLMRDKLATLLTCSRMDKAKEEQTKTVRQSRLKSGAYCFSPPARYLSRSTAARSAGEYRRVKRFAFSTYQLIPELVPVFLRICIIALTERNLPTY